MSYVDVADVELFSRVAPLQVASGVDVIVSDNSSNYVRGGDPLRPLRGHKHPWLIVKDTSRGLFWPEPHLVVKCAT